MSFESYLLNTGSFPRDGKADGKYGEGLTLSRKADTLICNTDEGEVAERA
jgi:hypothetical protein